MIVFLWFCLIPIVLFCFLDTLYLQQEHKFVEMYNAYVKDKTNKSEVFDMPMKNYAKSIKGFFKAFLSWSIIFVYPVMTVVIILILILKK